MTSSATSPLLPSQTPLSTFAPLPLTRRGYGIQLSAHPKDGRIAYTNGRLVILRSLLTPTDSLIFCEHKAVVNVATFSPSGFWVASGDDEGNLLIWSYPQLKIKSQFRVGNKILDIDWDDTSTRLVVAGDGQHKAKVISWDSGNNLGELTMHSLPAITCSYKKTRPFKVVTGSEDLTVNLYDGPPFKYNQSYKGHTRYPNCVRFSPSGDFYATVGADSKIFLFNGTSGEKVKDIEGGNNGHKGAIYSFSWSPCSKFILTAGADKTSKVWNVENGTCISTYTMGKDVNDMQVGVLWYNTTGGESKESKDIAVSVSLSGAINYLDVSGQGSHTLSPSRVLHGHQNTITSISISPSTNQFYTSGMSGEVTQWDFKSGEAVWMKGKSHGGKVINTVLLSSDNKSIITFGMDDKVHLSDRKSGEINGDGKDLGGLSISSASNPKDPQQSVAVLAQEKLLIIRGDNVVSTVQLGFVPTCVCYSNDGNGVYVGGKNKVIQYYSLSKDNATKGNTITTHDKPLTSLRCSPNNTLLLSTSTDASVYFHTLPSYELKNKSGWRFHQAGIVDADFIGNSRAVTGSIDTNIIIWNDLKEWNGSERVVIKNAHSQDVTMVRAWDEQTVISVSQDKTIRMWKV